MRCIYPFLFLLFCLPTVARAQTPTAAEQAAIDLFKAGKTDEAQAAFTTILKAHPMNTNAINAMSQICFAKGDYAAAYKWAGDGMKLDKNNPNFAITRAKAALKIDKAAEALTLMDAVVAKDPSLAYAQLVRGHALDAAGQPQQAIGAYSKAIAADATFADAYDARGGDFQSLSRYADALKDYTQYLTIDPDNVSVNNKRAVVNYFMGNVDAALTDYSKSVSLDSKNPTSLTGRGMMYVENKQYSNALADFQKAIELDATYAEAYYGTARAYNGTKAYAQALPMIEKAVALSPKMPPYLAIYCMTLIGLDRDAEVIPVADRILAINDQNTDAYILKASAQSNISDFAGGITTATNGISKVPGNYMLYMVRAGIYRQAGNTTAADADDAKAKELGTN